MIDRQLAVRTFNYCKEYNYQMQGRKIALNIRPQLSKASFIDAKTTKKSMPKPKMVSKDVQHQFYSSKTSNFSSTKNIKTRKTSMLSHDGAQTKNTSSNGDHPGSLKNKTTNTQRLPEIYHPKPHSNKYFSTGKFEQKISQPIEKVIGPQKGSQQETSRMSQSSVKSNFKADLTNKNRSNSRKQYFEKPIELTKQQKLQMYRMVRSDFHEIINASNRVAIRNPKNHFRAYIEKGNNGILVKQILKKRWWWHLEEDPSKANFVWTQWYNKDFADNLPLSNFNNQTILVDEYMKRDLNSEIKDKSKAIKKLIDEETFQKLQNAIRVISNANITFKQSKSIHQQPLIKNTQTMNVMTVCEQQMIHNHVDGCLQLHSKKLLFMNFSKFMKSKNYNPFDYIPETYFIDSLQSPSVEQVLGKYDQLANSGEQKNVWIIKPGQNSNRGNGIKVVCSKQKIEQQLNKRLTNQDNNWRRTVIIQKYLEKCFLINNRKFDIRCYLLITTVNGILKGYWYKDGYIRTSSAEYSLQNMDDQMIHLTNDAIQKKGNQYGKHQDLNKMSYDGFRSYLKKIGQDPLKFDQSYEQMKRISYYLIASVANQIKKKQFTFELFGLDFMLDNEMKPLLIQANSNPCLDNKGKILSKLIHDLVDNVLMTAVDPIFPPPQSAIRRGSQYLNKDYFEANKFELIFTGKSRIQMNLSQRHLTDNSIVSKSIFNDLSSPTMTTSAQK